MKKPKIENSLGRCQNCILDILLLLPVTNTTPPPPFPPFLPPAVSGPLVCTEAASFSPDRLAGCGRARQFLLQRLIESLRAVVVSSVCNCDWSASDGPQRGDAVLLVDYVGCERVGPGEPRTRPDPRSRISFFTHFPRRMDPLWGEGGRGAGDFPASSYRPEDLSFSREGVCGAIALEFVDLTVNLLEEGWFCAKIQDINLFNLGNKHLQMDDSKLLKLFSGCYMYTQKDVESIPLQRTNQPSSLQLSVALKRVCFCKSNQRLSTLDPALYPMVFGFDHLLGSFAVAGHFT